MTLRTLLAAALTFSASAALAATAEGTFDRTLTFSGAATVSVATGSGYIHVYPGPDNQFHITGHVHANTGWFTSDSDARDRVKRVVASPPIVQSGNIIVIGNVHADSELFHNIAIDYDVTTPHATTLKATSGSGGLEIGGIEGTVTAETGSGSIHVDNIGPSARLETGSGSIRAANVHGAASLETGSGSIELSVSAPGDVKAETGSGSIHINGVSGGLHAEAGSGSLEISGNPTAEWRLESGSGGIHLTLDPAAHFNLNAETSSGSVQVDRPIVMQGALNKHHVTGTVNGGGPTVRATTGSGSITIH